MITSAFVKIWEELAGAVIWDDRTQTASFEYDPNFVRQGVDLAPIKMPLRSSIVYSFPELRAKEGEYDTFKGLPGLLADALPDKYGNQLINTWLIRNNRLPNSMNPVEQLCFIGNRGMGALEFEPAQYQDESRAFRVEVDSLVAVAKQVLDERSTFETNIQGVRQEGMMDILRIGTSAGGARPKAIIAYNSKTGEVRSGQTSAPKGFEHYLIKLDGVSDIQFGESNGWGRVEMAYHLMAVACGIEMMPCQLLEENGRAHFMTQRFDRSGGSTKYHVQTFCAMQHADFNDMQSYSYEQIFQTMRVLGLPYPQADQMFRRMVFNIIAKNCDDHAKNFAFRLRPGHTWELSPAYDICYAYRPESMWVSRHALSTNGKRENYSISDLLNVANEMNISKPNDIIQEVQQVVDKWRDYARQVKLNDVLTQRIESNLLHF